MHDDISNHEEGRPLSTTQDDELIERIADAIIHHPGYRFGTPEQRDAVARELARPVAQALRPYRGDAVETWLTAKRDERDDNYEKWQTIDDLLEAYRAHADLLLPLSSDSSEGPMPELPLEGSTVTDIDTLAATIRAGADAEEAVATAATPGPWFPEEPMLADVVTSALLGRVADCSVGTGYRPQSLPDAKHIARHDPASVLARVSRDRRLLGLLLAEKHGAADSGVRYRPCATLADLADPCDCGRDARVSAYLALLAEGYSTDGQASD